MSMSEQLKQTMIAALNRRAQNGLHLHHKDCIHNLAPEEQIAVRGRSVKSWMALHGSMPEQITPDQWEASS